MSAELLDDLGLEGEPRPWTLPDGVGERFVPAGLLLGQGQNPLEVVLAMTPDRPPAGAVRTLWEKRRGKRASPVFCVAVYRQSGTMRAAACGPSGDDPRVVFGLDLGQVGRICEAALAEPDRHAAARLVAETLPEDDADLPGLRNAGMFATHELRTGVAERADWDAAQRAGEALLSSNGRDLVEQLGFSIERRDTTTSVLRADGAARAVAVFLQESESPEGAEQRYGGVSPAAHALAAADREALPYAVLTRGRQIRLYAAGRDVGVGRKGRAETFVELNLAVLPTAAAGYLPLIFGAEALRVGGSFEDVLERSRDFAAGLGERQCSADAVRVLDQETHVRAYDAWESARQDVYSSWQRATDPANLQPKIPKPMRDAADLLRANPPPELGQRELDRLCDAIEAPYGTRIQRLVRDALDSEEAPVDQAREVVRVVTELGLEPAPAPEPLPVIELDDLHLVCWLAIVGVESPA